MMDPQNHTRYSAMHDELHLEAQHTRQDFEIRSPYRDAANIPKLTSVLSFRSNGYAYQEPWPSWTRNSCKADSSKYKLLGSMTSNRDRSTVPDKAKQDLFLVVFWGSGKV